MARFAVSLFALATALIVALADTANLGFLYNVYAFPDGDKAGHFALYGTVTLLVRLAIHRLHAEGRSTHTALKISFTVALVATLDEFSQLWLPARSADWLDLLGSWAGVAAGTSMAALIRGEACAGTSWWQVVAQLPH